jgi:parvulin-like peptidyl-prolyl isomerase
MGAPWRSLPLAVLLLLPACSEKGPAASPALARVNGQLITLMDLDRERRLRLFGLKGKLEQGDLLDEMIDRLLMLQEARRIGLRPSREEWDGMVREAGSGYSLEGLKAALTGQGIGLAEWQENLGQQWIVQALVRQEVSADLKVSEQEVQDYYWEHLGDFRFPEKRRLRQVVTANRAEADQALREIRLGDSFSEVAIRASQGPEAPSGGDLGWVAKSSLPASLASKAFALPVGGISAVLRSPYGFHILQVEAVRPSGVASLASAGPGIRETLASAKQQLPYQAWLLSLRRRAKIYRFDRAFQGSAGPSH